MPVNVTLPGCDYDACTFNRSSENTVELTFRPERSLRMAYASVEIYGDEDWITLSNKVSICPYLKKGRCPMVMWHRYTYPSIVRVPINFPNNTMTAIRIRAFDVKCETIVCVQIDARIVEWTWHNGKWNDVHFELIKPFERICVVWFHFGCASFITRYANILIKSRRDCSEWQSINGNFVILE